MAEQKKNKFEDLTEKLIKQLEEGTAPWQRPWKGGVVMAPKNPTTGNHYKGVNVLILLSAGHVDPRWMSYRQAEKIGAQVKKGERGTPIVFWKTHEEKVMRDEKGKPIIGEDGQVRKEEIKYERPRAMWSTVFNAEQIDGIPPFEVKNYKEPTWEDLARAERALEQSGVPIKELKGSARAFYSPSKDEITLPARGQFENASNFYQTALHEIVHATGHSTRLDRDLTGGFGSAKYAREELVAELGSLFIGLETGTGFTPNDQANSAAYLKSWVSALRENPLEIMQAAGKAQQANNFIMQRVQQYEKDHGITVEELETPQEPLVMPIAQEEIDKAMHNIRTKLDNAVESRKIEDVLTTISFAKANGTPEPSPEMLDIFDKMEAVGRVVSLNEITSQEAAAEWKSLDDLHAEYKKEDDKWMNLVADHLKKEKEPTKSRDERHYIDVPYREKNEAKALGAKWDKALVSWYVPAGVPIEKFDKWTKARGENQKQDWTIAAEETKATDKETTRASEITAINDAANEMKPDKISADEATKEESKTYISVSYYDRHDAKKLGAQWDGKAKSWYFERDLKPENKEQLLAKYSKANSKTKENTQETLLPEQSFARELAQLGCDLEGGKHPVMNGEKQRIKVHGDKGAERSGFYVAHKDGRPNAFFVNNRTGETLKWKGQGEQLTVEQRNELMAKAQERQKEIERTREARELETKKQIKSNIERWTPAREASFETDNYLDKKGIAPTPGTYKTEYGDLCIPAVDIQGDVWSAQYIKSDGSSKSFASNGRLEGMFHPVAAHIDQFEHAKAIIIAEGYATAVSIHEATDMPTVVAFNASGLKKVAEQFREKYPDQPILIAGDDDKHLLKHPHIQKNIGHEKAKEAAEAVNGVAIIPKFSSGEQRKDPKGFTDFNDLALKSSLGKEGVKNQIESGMEKAVKKMRTQERDKTQKRQAVQDIER